MATGDASWGSPGEDVYAFLIKRSGGPVAHVRKNTGVVCDASFDSESVASTKTAHTVLYVQEIERAFGVSGVRPTIIGTDSSSNLAVARRQGAAARSRHSLRRWANLIKRMEDNEIYLAKVGTAEMPCDFLTKWVSKERLRKSLEFATNSLNVVAIDGLGCTRDSRADAARTREGAWQPEWTVSGSVRVGESAGYSPRVL